MPERRTVQIKMPMAGMTHSNRCAHGASFSKAIARIGKAYRILLSPLVGTPHRCVPAGEAAMWRSKLDGPALQPINQQMLTHELIRVSSGRK